MKTHKLVDVLPSDPTVSSSLSNTNGGSGQRTMATHTYTTLNESTEDHSRAARHRTSRKTSQRTIPSNCSYLQKRALRKFIIRSKPLIESTQNFIRYVPNVMVSLSFFLFTYDCTRQGTLALPRRFLKHYF